jgi:catechol 2,3-dioxygenase-like lactoylglutathione lyase family enzyme
MKSSFLILPAAAAIAWVGTNPAAQTPPVLPTPGFHHLHLNSVNPEAAIDFYTAQFPTTSKATFAGQPALKSPNNVWVLFTKVATPPATAPQTAYWHFGWHVTDVHKSVQSYLQRGVTLLPLYVEEAGGTVFTSADTWPGTGGALGLTKAGIADAKAKGVKPTGAAGFAYMRGPDDALIEYQGNQPAERFNHLHMFQDQPFCAQLWYQAHLNQPVRTPPPNQPVRTEANCRVERGPDKTWPALDWNGMYRTPAIQTTTFSDVSLYWYMNQGENGAAPHEGAPYGSTRGHLMDHMGLSVTDLDAWIAKLRAENVTFLEQPYKIGDYRAVMIEGPSREAIELIEIK